MSDNSTIRRAKHDGDNPYFLMRRDTAQDHSISAEALGVLTEVLSRPDNWQVRVSQLTNRTGLGRDRAYRILNELIQARYVERIQCRDAHGRVTSTEYVVYELQLPEKPDTVKPDTENPHITYNREVQKKEITYSLSPSGDLAPSEPQKPSKAKSKPPSRLYREPSTPTDEVTPEAARINALPPVSFDDFGKRDDDSSPASRTDGLFDAVFNVFGIADAEKRLNSQAGKYVMLLAGTAKGNDEWANNALPKAWGFTGDHLRQWARWYQETVLKNDPNMNMLNKPGAIAASIQGWWAKGRPLSSKDAATKHAVRATPQPTVEEAVPLTEAERDQRLQQLRELKERYGKK